MSNKLWGGRFEKATDKRVEQFTSSLSVDMRLWEVDITASIAHARMLGAVGVLNKAASDRIIEGLESVREDIASGSVKFDSQAEDVHSEVERLLREKVGPLAGALHTARSRNDQVATDTRLYLRGQIDILADDIYQLQCWLHEKAQHNQDCMLPGLTHMQHAQPVSFAHHLLAYFWMLQRDRERLQDLRKRVNVLPLGSAALAGTSFPINRRMVAEELGFQAVAENSLDAVSDRDFIVEFLSAASLIMMHLSRFSEELIVWSTPEFNFVILDDAVTTGSSIMPQKKNPDVAELIRGRVGSVYGQLMASLTMLKALPLAYNRDLQEDKTHLFSALDTVNSCVNMMYLMLSTAEFRTDQMAAKLIGDFSNATDLADYLVRKNLPFREAHEVIGRMVSTCIKKHRSLESLSFAELKEFSELFDEDALANLPHAAVMDASCCSG
jgi:argininosuccinate lyase